MARLYDVSADAQNDLFEIWRRVAEDSVDLANRIEGEFYNLFASLGRMPGQGHTRKDLTKRPVLFFPLYSFLVVYQPDVNPVRIMAVLRGRRNVKQILKEPLV
jgi:antitoxin ParD1/3/4/toxin ParE1/3/4